MNATSDVAPLNDKGVWLVLTSVLAISKDDTADQDNNQGRHRGKRDPPSKSDHRGTRSFVVLDESSHQASLLFDLLNLGHNGGGGHFAIKKSLRVLGGRKHYHLLTAFGQCGIVSYLLCEATTDGTNCGNTNAGAEFLDISIASLCERNTLAILPNGHSCCAGNFTGALTFRYGVVLFNEALEHSSLTVSTALQFE